ncbi:MAG: hypothetical protein A2149_09480 [Candidatus Schekmanbacteria bacterium RBG_16_38_11]|uniref:Uncharacterized protein n=1 Tax=Candidatus Schekmanbacteria bacterium RBG_16_38_11 TaxID=1817880 RepID=A0A1F7RTH7_9BACT|nr:MAG: hypothetical protein A2149_09480 [Candidatus Schekmanbacteria bacterium RBG_16_38_11]
MFGNTSVIPHAPVLTKVGNAESSISRGNENPVHFKSPPLLPACRQAGGDSVWIPAFAGMTAVNIIFYPDAKHRGILLIKNHIEKGREFKDSLTV